MISRLILIVKTSPPNVKIKEPDNLFEMNSFFHSQFYSKRRVHIDCNLLRSAALMSGGLHKGINWFWNKYRNL